MAKANWVIIIVVVVVVIGGLIEHLADEYWDDREKSRQECLAIGGSYVAGRLTEAEIDLRNLKFLWTNE